MIRKKGGLGRGLDALFSDNAADAERSVSLQITDVEPNRRQPRKTFDETALNDLAESIRLHGVLQPILVRPLPGGTYQIVAGERRWRASRIAGLAEIPAVIREMDDRTVMELAMIENLQREDLNQVEEAEGYRLLMETFSMTQDQVADRVGKSRSAVANALRLLTLDPVTLDAVRHNQISAGHARAMLRTDDPQTRGRLRQMATQGASVRDLERAAQPPKPARPAQPDWPDDRPAQNTPATGYSGASGMAGASGMTGASDMTGATSGNSNFYREVELAMKEELHRYVRITPTGRGRGTILVEFFNDQELADIAARIAGEYR